jgi:DNA-directed RNA polymerase alpha subunit
MPTKIKVITQGPTPISDLKFTTRINNALQCENIHTVEELCARSAHNLLKVVGISRKSIEHIRYALSFKGLHLKGDLLDDYK